MPRISKKAAIVALSTQAHRSAGASTKRGEALLALIERRKARITEDFYDIGEALNELAKKKLYVALGFTTFREMLTKRGVLGHTQANKLMQVVRAIPRDRALGLGEERSYAITQLSAALAEAPEVLLAHGSVQVKGKRVALAKASVADIAHAVLAANRAKHPASPENAARHDAEKLARATQARLRAAGASHATVEARRRAKGWVAVIEIDLAMSARVELRKR